MKKCPLVENGECRVPQIKKIVAGECVYNGKCIMKILPSDLSKKIVEAKDKSHTDKVVLPEEVLQKLQPEILAALQ